MMMKSARVSAFTVAALTCSLALSACGSADESKSSGQGNQDVAIGGKQFSAADEATAKLGSDAAPGQFPRTVKHSLGAAQINSAPKRVVVLDTGELDGVLSLGIKPVGMVTTKGANPTPSYLADKVKGVPSVGTINEVNVEQIAALKPDLIVGSKLRAEKLYPQLSQIAPTVMSIRPGFPWKENFLLLGDALGKEKQAMNVLNAYATSAADLKKKAPKGVEVSLLRFMPGKTRLYGNKSLIGVVLQDAGIARPKKQNVNDLAVEISPEKLDEAAGDYIFYTSYATPDATGETKALAGQQWKNLAAVKGGKAIRVNDDVWFLGLGPTGAQQIVKDLGAALK